jgi:hypothetical protein
MGKLHELLAVESDLKSKAQSELGRIKGLFTSGAERLTGLTRTYQPLREDGQDFPDEVVEMATTAPNELARLRHMFGSWLDVAVQKEATNATTSANVIVDSKTILSDLPAPALLNLEAKLADLRKAYEVIPTIDPARQWTWDTGLGCYVSAIERQHRTQKLQEPITLAEATKEHPAQAQLVTRDVIIGTLSTTIHSGALSVTEKRARLDRLDELARAVKQARQRANCAEVKPLSVADKIFDFINGK